MSPDLIHFLFQGFSFKDIDKFSENVKIYANYQESIKKLSFCFKSTGVHVTKSIIISKLMLQFSQQ